jgi:hypothetical protein
MFSGVDEDDSRQYAKKWLETLSTLVDSPNTTEVVHIIKSGYLMKRGRYNKAFKMRWFVMTSDYRLVG